MRVTDESMAGQVIRLRDALRDSDDVQDVYSNFDAPDEVPAKLSV